MKSLICLSFALCIGLLAVWPALSRSESAPGREPTLPGMRPAIDASKFSSLQAAIDALPPDGGVVQIPAGTFEIDRPLLVTQEDVRIAGSGTATHIKNVNKSGEPALVLRPAAAATPQGKPARIWRLQLADFRITGNDKSGHGIVAQGVNELFIQGVTCSHHGKDGLHMRDCYEDPRICNSLFTYNRQTGLNIIGGHDIVVSGNQFEENGDALRCVDSFNLCMTGNCIDDHLAGGVIIENTYGSVVSGNMIEECNGAAVVLDRDCYGITLSANVIAHNGLGIDLRDAHGCTVSANTFTINKEHALRIGAGSGRITITGNNFSNSYIGQGAKRRANDLAAAGLTLAGGSDLAISGNVFSDVEPGALHLTDDASRRILFAGNVIVGLGGDHARLKDSVVDKNLTD